MKVDPVLSALKEAVDYILADAGITAFDLKGMRTATFEARPFGDDSVLVPFDAAKALRIIRKAEAKASEVAHG